MTELDEAMVERVARIIDPSAWAVMDSYLGDMLRKYKGQNISYDIDQFKHKGSLAKARAALTAILPDLREQHYAECAAGIPKHIVEQVLSMGRVEWGATAEQVSADHIASFENTLRLTREYFNLDDAPVQMHGLYLEGTETVLCHTGTSPNSSPNAQALVGAWNYLFDMCKAAERRDHITKEGE